MSATSVDLTLTVDSVKLTSVSDVKVDYHLSSSLYTDAVEVPGSLMSHEFTIDNAYSKSHFSNRGKRGSYLIREGRRNIRWLIDRELADRTQQ